jgi:hypothetical protein
MSKDVVKKDWKLYKLNASLSDGDRLFAIEGCVDSKTGDMRFYKVDGDDDLRTDFKTLISLRDFLIDLNLDKITNPKDCDTLCDIDDRYVTKEEFESFKGSTGYSIGKITSILAKLAIRTL